MGKAVKLVGLIKKYLDEKKRVSAQKQLDQILESALKKAACTSDGVSMHRSKIRKNGETSKLYFGEYDYFCYDSRECIYRDVKNNTRYCMFNERLNDIKNKLPNSGF